jgi:hypothetical protein
MRESALPRDSQFGLCHRQQGPRLLQACKVKVMVLRYLVTAKQTGCDRQLLGSLDQCLVRKGS